jgi:hypothetical protein
MLDFRTARIAVAPVGGSLRLDLQQFGRLPGLLLQLLRQCITATLARLPCGKLLAVDFDFGMFGNAFINFVHYP